MSEQRYDFTTGELEMVENCLTTAIEHYVLRDLNGQTEALQARKIVGAISLVHHWRAVAPPSVQRCIVQTDIEETTTEHLLIGREQIGVAVAAMCLVVTQFEGAAYTDGSNAIDKLQEILAEGKDIKYFLLGGFGLLSAAGPAAVDAVEAL